MTSHARRRRLESSSACRFCNANCNTMKCEGTAKLAVPLLFNRKPRREVRSLTLRTRLSDAWLRLTASGADETANTATTGARKTVMLPSIFGPHGAGPYGAGRAARSAAPKPTAANLRRFAETPVARRAL